MTPTHLVDQNAPKVLVIDDEDYVADMIATALEREGMQTHVAHNGREALAQTEHLSFDLLIIDIMMPYMSGIELIQRLQARDQLKEVPVILMSAGARPKEQQPHVLFLPKPLDLDELLAVVADTLRRGQTI